jgi:hypothetical protein
MKTPEKRTARLAEKLQQAAEQGSAEKFAGAIIDTIDQSMRDRNRPGRRDRQAGPGGSLLGTSGDPKPW